MSEPKPKKRGDSEAKKRYDSKTYELIAVRFRKEDDADILDLLEDQKSQGYSLREAFRNLIFRDE